MRIIIITYFLLIAFFLQSCEDKGINPAGYELYITESFDKNPAISPDGSLLAYYHKCLVSPEPVDYPTGLYVTNIDGSNKKLLLRGDHFNPDWSPDGKNIVFSSNGVLNIIDVNGDNLRTFSGLPGFQGLPLHSPDWSPDGKQIIFSAPLTLDGGVFMVSPDFIKVRRLFLPITNNGMYASWAPDMSKILYIKGNSSLKSVEIFVIDTAQIFEQQLTNDFNDDRDVRWSPDGKKIAFNSDNRISIIDIDQTHRKTLSYGQGPSWSPTSDFLIYSFANNDFTREVLWRINIDGSNKTQITF